MRAMSLRLLPSGTVKRYVTTSPLMSLFMTCTGVIDAIWDSATGAARVTELT
mgnify:CR=1 FL=1